MRRFSFVLMILTQSTLLFGQNAPVILNEYNAVNDEGYLHGGDKLKDNDGGAASDSFFGRVKANGGDWFELVVTHDHLDMRRWALEYSWFDESKNRNMVKAIRLTDHHLWSDLRAGTIITVAEDVPEDVGYDPARGDWWINVRANKKLGRGTYIERVNFKVNANNWRLAIKDSSGAVRFGPAGEGISPNNGINSREVFRLEADPAAAVPANSQYYSHGRDSSTFGAPNRWKTGVQDFSALRKKVNNE
ncbi:MAG: hypothetical protein JXD23_08825 [Spirochaetales bacterium]|nr:hypothetical protein [Spirochaetales bacterium]